MIELISSLFSEGDPIKLEYGQKAQIVSGTIFKITTDSIAIKKFEGGIAGIKGTEIISFDTIETPNQTITKPVQETYAQVSPNNEPKISDNSENQTPSVQSPVKPFNVSEEQKEDIVATPTPPLQKDKRITPQTATTSSKEVKKERIKDAKHNSKGTLNGGKTNNLRDLASLLGMEGSISQMREKENNAVVREMGEIQSIGPQFGFIRDFKTSAKLWFACSELIDSTNTAYPRGEYVVYTRSKNYAGDTAICIHKPMQIKELLTLVDNLVKAGKKTDANEVLMHIFSSYPDCQIAIEKQKEINRSYQNHSNKTSFSTGATSLYDKARKYNDAKNFGKQ